MSERYDHVGASGAREQLVLRALEPGEVGAEGEDPEIGLVAEHRERQHLVRRRS